MPFTAWTPLCDIYETDKELVLKMELAEMKKEDVHVTIENNLLTLRGERKFDETIERENFHRVTVNSFAPSHCRHLSTATRSLPSSKMGC
jgi:HSP20 family molecular chaperone IbpA